LLKGKKKSFVIHLDIFYNRHMRMVNLKESTFVNETIRRLRYMTLKYIHMYTLIEFVLQNTFLKKITLRINFHL